MEFYVDALKGKNTAVWSNLESFYYRKDLSCYEDDSDEENISKTLPFEKNPRFLLTNNEEFMDFAFEMLAKSDETQKAVWSLLSKLAVSPVIFRKIVLLDALEG